MANITDIVVIDAINKQLADRGRSLDGRPILRLVFSDDLLEKRVGTYTDWYGHILIRQEYRALRELPKYNYIKGKWILERLTYLDPENAIVKDELVEATNGTYEPLYVFQDKEYNALPVNWRIVEQILWNLENWTPTKGNEKTVENESQEALREEIAYFEEQIGPSQRSALFAAEAAEFFDSTKQPFMSKQEKSDESVVCSGSDNGQDSLRSSEPATTSEA